MYKYKNKDENIRQNNAYMFAKTLSMFEWEGLPKTIPKRELEKLLQENGFAFITKYGDDLYAFNGTLGGEQDVYGNYKTITINNTGLNFNKTLSVFDDGVLIFNDDSRIGLLPLFNKYHFMMVENDINMVIRGYNSRIQKLISASDDKTTASAEKYLQKVVTGEMGVVGESALFDGIRLQSTATGQGDNITPMIEFQQYMRGTLYNEVGLNANFNMKRERLTGGEMEANDDALYPFVDNMMQCRLIAALEINEKYGTSILVDYGSVWYKKNSDLVDDIVNQAGGDNEESTVGANNEDLINNEEGGQNEQQLENGSYRDNQSSVEDIGEEKTIEDIQEILLDEELSEEERLEWAALLEELQRGNDGNIE